MAESMFNSNVTTRAALILAAFLLISGFSEQKNAANQSQPSDERKAQDALPQSGDPVWNVFTKCKVHFDNKKHTYSIDYTSEVKEMVGKRVTISGFLMPLDATEKSNHYLLSKRTPTCAFCPPGEPNEIIEIFTKKPIRWEDGIFIITGTMKFTSNPDLGLFFQLNDSDSSTTKAPKSASKLPII